MEDEQIVELYFARSEKAIQATSDKYGSYLNQIAYNILQNSSDTEEIVNDTYLGAWNAIPPTKPDSLRHFLSRITRNLAFTRLDYKLAGKRYALLEELDECIPDYTAGPEQQSEINELASILNRFLGTLKPIDCAVFLARYYYSYSLSEIAVRYDMTERHAKYLLAKLRSQLHNYLDKEKYEL